MSLRRNLPEIVMFVAIVAVGVLDLALYSGAVQGEDAVRIGRGAGLSEDEAVGDLQRDAADEAELDDSGDLPGRYVASQGRMHTPSFPLAQRVPFCEGDPAEDCYASNPPTSGLHLPVVRDADLGGGNIVNIPPDPGIYEFEFPREAIPHLQEHAGVFLGYRCTGPDCEATVERTRALVGEELSLGARVVMAPTSDLAEDTMALASWTRIDTFSLEEFDEARVRDFIKAHSCRFDPEGFCPETAVN